MTPQKSYAMALIISLLMLVLACNETRPVETTSPESESTDGDKTPKSNGSSTSTESNEDTAPANNSAEQVGTEATTFKASIENPSGQDLGDNLSVFVIWTSTRYTDEDNMAVERIGTVKPSGVFELRKTTPKPSWWSKSPQEAYVGVVFIAPSSAIAKDGAVTEEEFNTIQSKILGASTKTYLVYQQNSGTTFDWVKYFHKGYSCATPEPESANSTKDKFKSAPCSDFKITVAALEQLKFANWY